MLARVLAMALCPYPRTRVCLFVCLSQVGVLSKWMNESRWFLAWELPSTNPTLCCTEIRALAKGYFPLELLSTLGTLL